MRLRTRRARAATRMVCGVVARDGAVGGGAERLRRRIGSGAIVVKRGTMASTTFAVVGIYAVAAIACRAAYVVLVFVADRATQLAHYSASFDPAEIPTPTLAAMAYMPFAEECYACQMDDSSLKAAILASARALCERALAT